MLKYLQRKEEWSLGDVPNLEGRAPAAEGSASSPAHSTPRRALSNPSPFSPSTQADSASQGGLTEMVGRGDHPSQAKSAESSAPTPERRNANLGEQSHNGRRRRKGRRTEGVLDAMGANEGEMVGPVVGAAAGRIAEPIPEITNRALPSDCQSAAPEVPVYETLGVEPHADGGENHVDQTSVRTMLRKAIVSSDLAEAEQLLGQVGACELLSDYLLFHLAARVGNIEIASLLAGKGGPGLLFCKCRLGRTALHVAAASGHVSMVKWLVEAGEDLVLASDTLGRTALHWAAGCGHPGAMPNGPGGAHTPGTSAQFSSRDRPASLGFQPVDDLGSHLHQRAADSQGSSQVAKLLIDAGGAPLLLARDKHGRTALHAAARAGHADLAEVLLQATYATHAVQERNGGLLEARDIAGRTALHVAAVSNQAAVAKLLVVAGGTELVLVADAAGNTSLHLAAAEGAAATAELLAQRGGTAALRAQAGCGTPLHAAAMVGTAETVRRLLAVGSGIMASGELLLARDEEGRTPLHVAAGNGHVEVVRLLLEAAGRHTKALVSARDELVKFPCQERGRRHCCIGFRAAVVAMPAAWIGRGGLHGSPPWLRKHAKSNCSQ